MVRSTNMPYPDCSNSLEGVNNNAILFQLPGEDLEVPLVCDARPQNVFLFLRWCKQPSHVCTGHLINLKCGFEGYQELSTRIYDPQQDSFIIPKLTKTTTACTTHTFRTHLIIKRVVWWQGYHLLWFGKWQFLFLLKIQLSHQGIHFTCLLKSSINKHKLWKVWPLYS